MCSSGHNLAAKIHPKHPVAFCVVEIKYRVLNVPSLLALMKDRRVFKLLLRCVCTLMKSATRIRMSYNG